MYRHRIGLWVVTALAALCAAGILSSCNARKKNTALSRQYTAFITRYNIHYNGDKHYKETLEDLEKAYEDDYTTFLYFHPAEAKNNPKAPQPAGDFTRSIEKAQKAIQIRSITKKPAKKRGKSNDAAYKAWMKREEYNPFLHNDWMMMGRSQYMNGDFLGAAATFFYTSRHFSWLTATVTEAKLWQARSYLALDWLFEAENILNRIKPDELTSKELNALYNIDMGELELKQENFDKAAGYVREAIKLTRGIQKTRLNFLLGQILERTGDKKGAYAAFAKAASASNVSYRARFNARIKQTEVFDGNDIAGEVKALRRMARLDLNKEYLDQIYYAIGNLYLSRRDTVHAIEAYREAAEKSTRNGIEKAISQITLGALYYDRREYELAQPCYAEAVPLLPDNYPDLNVLKKRSDVLDELALYSQNVHLQDSLLRLAAMDSVQRMKVIDNIIEELKKKEKEEAEDAAREAYLADQAAQGNNLQSNAKDPQAFNLNTDNSWYFYNQAAKNAGKTDFQRRWGSRKLEDNWRRRNKSSFSTADFAGGDTGEAAEKPEDAGESAAEETPQTEEDKAKAARAEDPHFPEYYLKQIPFTTEQKVTANDVIQEGLYNMGVILKDKLEDFPAAEAEFDRLLSRYPDNIYRLDTYYNLYLMYTRLGQSDRAEHYRALILKDFADSKYGQALKNPYYIDNLRNMENVQNSLYDSAYEAYMANDNARVHALYSEVAEKYPMSRLMPKFMFLEALAYVTERKPDEFNKTLRTLLERYPDTDLTPIASAWLKGLAQGRKLQTATSGGNMRGMIWDISLGGDSLRAAGDEKIDFKLDPQDRQLLVFVFPTDRVSSNELLYEIARHNFNAFVVKDFDLEQMNFGRLGMIVVKDFENLDELNHYRRVMAASPTFRLPAGVRPVVISAPNFDTLLKSGGTLDDYFRFLEEQNYLDAQSDILPYTEIETLEEADERAAAVRQEMQEQQSAEQQPSEQQPSDQPSQPEQQEPQVEPQPQLQQPQPQTPSPAKPQPSDKPRTPANRPKTQTPAKPAPAKPAPAAPAPVKKPEFEPGSEGDDDPLLNP